MSLEELLQQILLQLGSEEESGAEERRGRENSAAAIGSACLLCSLLHSRRERERREGERQARGKQAGRRQAAAALRVRAVRQSAVCPADATRCRPSLSTRVRSRERNAKRGSRQEKQQPIAVNAGKERREREREETDRSLCSVFDSKFSFPAYMQC